MITEPAPARASEADIRRFVMRFYQQVREDPELAPIFEARIGGRWEAHLERMVDFWSGVLLATGRYRGNPLEKHRDLPGVEARHYDRWMELFDATLAEVLAPHLAADVAARARRMRVVLERQPEREQAAAGAPRAPAAGRSYRPG